MAESKPAIAGVTRQSDLLQKSGPRACLTCHGNPGRLTKLVILRRDEHILAGPCCRLQQGVEVVGGVGAVSQPAGPQDRPREA